MHHPPFCMKREFSSAAGLIWVVTSKVQPTRKA